jgi:PEP-CTERM motif
VSTTDNETELIEGIEVTVSGTLTLTAQSVVAVTAVPEPSTWALLLAGAAAVLARVCKPTAGHGSALRRLA